MSIKITNACVCFGKGQSKTHALKEASFEINEGELFALIGPSGSGKSTLLRALAGLQRLTSGSIVQEGRVLDEGTQFIPPEKRGVGLMFQQYALFPHLNVSQNIAFGLRKNEASSKLRTKEMLELTELSHKREAPIAELSGGEQQRVALARALAPKPSILLLDEPFANLDARLRQSVRDEVSDLLRSQKQSALLVTHDQSEAMAFAERMAVIDQGRVLDVGTPRRLYQAPKSARSALLLGAVSFLKVSEKTCALGRVSDDSTLAMVRPHDVVLCERDEGVAARVEALRFLGADTLCTLLLGNGEKVQARFSGELNIEIEQELHIRARVRGVQE